MPPIRTVETTGSTNDDVAALAGEGAAEGLWLRAVRQSSGRGRQGREWHSPSGNLYASTLVRWTVADPPAPSLALVAAVALHEVLRTAAPKAAVSIKWPNDILAGPAKLAGILLERSEDAIVIGFGANLAHHPPGLDRPATSIAALSGAAPDAAIFLEDLAEAFERWLGRWRNEGIGRIRDRWLLAAHPVGTALSAEAAGERIHGLFDGLTEGGALRLRLADGAVQVVHAGDVFLL